MVESGVVASGGRELSGREPSRVDESGLDASTPLLPSGATAELSTEHATRSKNAGARGGR
jgi:hypothetical protein